MERSNAKLREECDQTKLEAETEQRRLGDEVARLQRELALKDERLTSADSQISIVTTERDNLRHRVAEVEDRVREKEEIVDRLRHEYNELLEKHLRTPKKVTTTSTTVKTVVDQDPLALPEPPKIDGSRDRHV